MTTGQPTTPTPASPAFGGASQLGGSALQPTDDHHKQMLGQIQNQLRGLDDEEVSNHQVEPVTADTPFTINGIDPTQPMIQAVQTITGVPGEEPSKTFLQKLKERVTKKHPGEEVKLR